MQKTKNKLFFITLGCPKNTVDSENMMYMCEQSGFVQVEDAGNADFIIINTCSFILDAKTESVDTILDAVELKKSYPDIRIIVTGCLSQRYYEDLTEEIPEVDLWLGTGDMFDIAKHLRILNDSTLSEQANSIQKKAYAEKKNAEIIETQRVVTTPTYAYVKLGEGCNKNCTYCIIPTLRGHQRDREFTQIVAEVQRLVEDGYSEIILISQDTGEYGMARYKKRRLAELLTLLDKIEGIRWIRLLYVYPETVTDELIEVMANSKHILHYIDIPIQHIDDAILKAMNRHTTKEDIYSVINRLRAAMPDIAIRSSFIAGFPSEKMSQVHNLADFFSEVKLTRLGVFAYSPEDGTPAAKMDNQISDTQRVERASYLMHVQQNISSQVMETFIGKTLSVVIEDYEAEEDGKNVYCARSYLDAPDIDGCVYVTTDKELCMGDYIDVTITDSMEYDLFAEY